MRNLIQRMFRDPKAISLSEFREKLAFEFGICFFSVSIITYLTYFSESAAMFSQKFWFIALINLVPLYFLIRLCRLFADRLSALYSDGQKISHIAVAVLSVFSVFNVYLLYLCTRNKILSPHAPLIFRKRWTMLSGLFVFIVLQIWFIYSGRSFPQVITISRFVNPPTLHYLNIAKFEAVWSFKLKERLKAGGMNFQDEYKKQNELSEMTSTGHVLATAVMATDVFKKKASSKLKTASPDAALELAESSMYINNTFQSQHHLYFKFSPIIFFSPREITEAAYLNLVDSQVRQRFDKQIHKKVMGIIATIKRKGIEKGTLTPEHLERIKKLEMSFQEYLAKEPGVRE